MIDTLLIIGFGLLITPVGWAIIYAVYASIRASQDPDYADELRSSNERDAKKRYYESRGMRQP